MTTPMPPAPPLPAQDAPAADQLRAAAAYETWLAQVMRTHPVDGERGSPDLSAWCAGVLEGAAEEMERLERHNSIDPDNPYRTRWMPSEMANAAMRLALFCNGARQREADAQGAPEGGDGG